MKIIDIFKSNISADTILNVIVQIILYLIGVLINAKIIFTCWQSRNHNKSWQLHILYSLSCIILFAFNIPFWIFSMASPNLSSFMGEWICYLAIFMNAFFVVIILMNSLLVSITKYIFVVHWDKALVYGHDKIQWASVILSVLITIPSAIVRTAMNRNYSTEDGPLHTCFGKERKESIEKSGWQDIPFWCFSTDLDPNEPWSYIPVVFLQIFCVLAHVVYGTMCCNLPEAFFYYQIFKTTKR